MKELMYQWMNNWITIPLPWFNLPGHNTAMTCWGEGISCGSHTYWPHTDMGGGLPRWVMSSMPGPSPRQHEHLRRYTQFTHTFILTRRIWEGWIWWPNDIRGSGGPNDSWHLSYRCGKIPKKKIYPGNLYRPGIEPGPAAWQARMLLPAPQRWTNK